MSNQKKIILGLLGIAAAGVVIGILLSSEKGGKVRKRIAVKASDIASCITEYINTGKEKMEDASDLAAR